MYNGHFLHVHVEISTTIEELKEPLQGKEGKNTLPIDND